MDDSRENDPGRREDVEGYNPRHAFTPFVCLQPKLGAGSPDWFMSQDVDASLSCSIDSIVLSTSGLEGGIPALHKNR